MALAGKEPEVRFAMSLHWIDILRDSLLRDLEATYLAALEVEHAREQRGPAKGRSIDEPTPEECVTYGLHPKQQELCTLFDIGAEKINAAEARAAARFKRLLSEGHAQSHRTLHGVADICAAIEALDGNLTISECDDIIDAAKAHLP